MAQGFGRSCFMGIKSKLIELKVQGSDNGERGLRRRRGGRVGN